MSDVDLSHIFPLEPLFRRHPWAPVVFVLCVFALGAVIDSI